MTSRYYKCEGLPQKHTPFLQPNNICVYSDQLGRLSILPGLTRTLSLSEGPLRIPIAQAPVEGTRAYDAYMFPLFPGERLNMNIHINYWNATEQTQYRHYKYNRTTGAQIGGYYSLQRASPRQNSLYSTSTLRRTPLSFSRPGIAWLVRLCRVQDHPKMDRKCQRMCPHRSGASSSHLASL